MADETTAVESPILRAALNDRTNTQSELDAILVAPTAEARALTDEEVAKFEDLAKRVASLDTQIGVLRSDEKRRSVAAAASATSNVGSDAGERGTSNPGAAGAGGVVVTREPMTYDPHGLNSYFRDLATIAMTAADPLTNADSARARLQQHGKEIVVEARHNKDLQRRLREIRATPASLGGTGDFEQRVTPNTTDGTGGEFVPPLWLVDRYAPYVRPGRVFANRVTNMPLPPGIDQINLPKITLGTQTAIQATQNSAVNSRDFTTSTVSCQVNTIAGQEDISMQLLDQSPLAMDGVIFDDLSRDYDQRLDLQVTAGTGLNGQHKGVLVVTQATSNTDITKANGVTVSSAVFWDGSTSATQYRSIVNGANAIETLRFDTPTGIWCHPRRANSWAYAADSATGRPLFVASANGRYNAVGTQEAAPTYQGVAGELYGLPVIKDANMSTTMNSTATTGGTADAIVVLKEDDLYLWEGTMRMRALPEVLSGTLSIRFQLWAYSAFMPDRFPPSISILTSNTGLAAPGF